MILVSHDAHFLATLSTRAVMLEDGQLKPAVTHWHQHRHDPAHFHPIDEDEAIGPRRGFPDSCDGTPSPKVSHWHYKSCPISPNQLSVRLGTVPQPMHRLGTTLDHRFGQPA